jgi:hypothetical protein
VNSLRCVRTVSVPFVGLSFSTILVAAACSSSGSSSPGAHPDGGSVLSGDATVGDSAPGLDGAAHDAATTSDGGSTPADAKADVQGAGESDGGSDALYDPVPTSCDGGGIPPVVGGTEACPDDKNLEGCSCPTEGATASCWPGYRSNEGVGDCRDGTTECTSQGGLLFWGACEGAVLPVQTTGPASCTCFSSGQWDVSNVYPCLATESDGTVTAMISTIQQGSTETCPTDFTQAPTQPWSTSTLEVDCSGEYTLCFTFKAGDPSNPLPTDCSIVQTCTQTHAAGGTSQAPPPLAGWLAQPSALACAQQFHDTGGYGEMSIQGQSDLCQPLAQEVFNRVTYCPADCTGPTPPAQCATCLAGGSGGTF